MLQKKNSELRQRNNEGYRQNRVKIVEFNEGFLMKKFIFSGFKGLSV